MFSMTTEYALRAMACLAINTGVLVSTNVIAAQTKVPPNYLAKVLQSLAGANLITGRRGVGGGYKLASPPGDISLLQVIRAVATVERITKCPLGLPNHGSTLCPLHRKADQAAAAVIDIYQNATLLDLLKADVPSKPLCDTALTAKLTINGSAAS